MRALLSVWDKSGIVELGRRLQAIGFEIVSTGNTLRALTEGGVAATAVSDVTGMPEMLEGRVKTLHPAIHAGLLARRDRADHLEEIAGYGIEPIDLVVSNLYPFGEAVRRSDVSLEQALENIDIGGPTLIRAAAKNFPAVLILVDPSDYDSVLDGLADAGKSGVSLERRRKLAAKAFAHVSAYDSVIAAYLRPADEFPQVLPIAGERAGELRYGENPHQPAALYRQLTPGGPRGIAAWQQLIGPEMSYNNYLDAAAAWAAACDFPEQTVVIVKHTVPCGIASHVDQATAYEQALASDPVSAFGGIVALNRPLDEAAAALIAKHRFDILLAPGFAPKALERLRRRRNLRILQTPPSDDDQSIELRVLDGVMLAQASDRVAPQPDTWTTATQRQPTDEEFAALAFAWRAVRHIKSNAIVLARGTATVGIGGGQPNRVDAVRIAVRRAGERAAGSVLASDAYFPFPDNVEVAAEAGVTAIAQPGGSVRDAESIAAADAAGLAMVMTGIRHFHH